jgi:nucleoside-diphosphate-sugar epimerase
MPKLGNKVALITGSDSGIGQAIAEEFAREGADVAVSFHTDQIGAEATRRQVEAHGRRAIIRQLDVRDESSVAAFFDDTATQLGASTVACPLTRQTVSTTVRISTPSSICAARSRASRRRSATSAIGSTAAFWTSETIPPSSSRISMAF